MRASKVYLRPIEVGDAPFLHRLFCWREYARMFYEETTTEQQWAQRIHNIREDSGMQHYVLCRIADDQPVGWLGHFAEDEELQVECLQILMIEHSQTRKGYAADAMGVWMDNLRQKGKKKIRLWTQANNTRAQAFYGAQGFTVVGCAMEDVDGGKSKEEFLILEYVLQSE